MIDSRVEQLSNMSVSLAAAGGHVLSTAAPAEGEQMDKPDDSVMTIDELSAYLKIAKSTLYKLAQEGSIPGQKVGRHWRFHRSVIDQWLARGVKRTKRK